MTHKTINGRELVFVEVPEGAIKFKISGSGWLCYAYKGGTWLVLSQPYETYDSHTVIGLAANLTESEWSGIVQVWASDLYGFYLNYRWPIGYPCVSSATQSAQSLLTSLNLKPATTLILERL